MILEQAHSLIRNTIRKSQGSYVSPEDIDLNLNRSLTDYVNDLLEQGMNANVQSLSRYISEENYGSNSSIKYTLPTNFLKEITIQSRMNGSTYEGDILTDQEFSDRRNSYITPPEFTHPIARLVGESIEILPVQGNYTLTYYREIVDCKYAYTSPTNRNIVFDEANSVDLDCNKGALSKIVSRALVYFGISLEAQNLVTEETISNS